MNLKFFVLALLLLASPSALAQDAPHPDRDTLCAIGRGKACEIQQAIDKGLFETGLRPRFPDHAKCRGIDEKWAISYTWKRGKEQYHGGIDMPAPFGTPIIAAADGEVVGVFDGVDGYRGREVILRHSPQDSGLPVWTYTQYSHFEELPALKLGERVKQGQVLGPTGNSGRGRKSTAQSTNRRPAIHFAAYFSPSEHFVISKDSVVVPVEGQWMDPNALFRGKLPLDSASLKALPEAEKEIPVAVMFPDGEVFPTGAKIVWPYVCASTKKGR